MSSERTREDVWADQVAMAEARGEPNPSELDPETARVLSELLGGGEVEQLAEYNRP